MRGLKETPVCPLQRPRSLLGKEGQVLRSGHYVELGRVLCPRGGPLVCGVCGKVCLFTTQRANLGFHRDREGIWRFSSYFAPPACVSEVPGPCWAGLSGLRHLSASSPLLPAEPFLSGCPLPLANTALLIALPAIVGPFTLYWDGGWVSAFQVVLAGLVRKGTQGLGSICTCFQLPLPCSFFLVVFPSRLTGEAVKRSQMCFPAGVS